MKLRNTIVQRILETGLSLDLAKVLGFTQGYIRTLAKKNDPNSFLTTMAAVEVIKKDMGILDDSEVLEKVVNVEPAKVA